MSNDGRIGGVWQGASIPSATPVIIAMNGAPMPCTVVLKSAAVGRLIELSADGGVEYFTPATLDATSATMQVLGIASPVSHVRVTGVANDTWSIR